MKHDLDSQDFELLPKELQEAFLDMESIFMVALDRMKLDFGPDYPEESWKQAPVIMQYVQSVIELAKLKYKQSKED